MRPNVPKCFFAKFTDKLNFCQVAGVLYIAVKKPWESYKWVIIESSTADMFFLMHLVKCAFHCAADTSHVESKNVCVQKLRSDSRKIEVKVTLQFWECIRSAGSISLSILFAFSFWSVVYRLYRLHSVPPFGSEIYFDIDVVSKSLGTFLHSVFSKFKKSAHPVLLCLQKVALSKLTVLVHYHFNYKKNNK